ncbi:hypothetical protein N431DRAFT_451625 [Stipitochalara longipes BDJ]|nr:hypothetical protein N431DRAFT_451625 [Stipitochalara longipes BDJ]
MSFVFSFLPIDPSAATQYAHAISPPLGAFLAFAGLKKLLTNWGAGWAVYRSNGFSPAEYRNTAIIEVVGALGLVFRSTRFSGLVTLILMIAWIEMETKRREKGDVVKPKSPLHLRIPARITQVLLAGLLWALWP